MSEIALSELAAQIAADKLKTFDLGGNVYAGRTSSVSYDLKGCLLQNGSVLVDAHYNTISNFKSDSVQVRMNGNGNLVTKGYFYENTVGVDAVILYKSYVYTLVNTNSAVTDCTFEGGNAGQANVSLNGTGMVCKRNLFLGACNPKPAIKMCGSNHIVEGNKVVFKYDPEADDDAGCIVVGRRWDWVNNTVRGNTIVMEEDAALETNRKISAVYLDDGISLQKVYNNQIYGFPIGVKLGGGCFNTISGNWFAYCGDAIRFDARYQEGYLDGAESLASLGNIPRDSAMWLKYASKLSKLSYRPTGNIERDSVVISCTAQFNMVDNILSYGKNSVSSMSVATSGAV